MTIITREVDIDLDVSDLAAAFAELCSDEQAQFLNDVGKVAKGWAKGLGWCGQACHIVDDLDRDGIEVVEALYDHLKGKDLLP